jgi:transcription termination/antitermination protein NusG
MPSLRVDNSGGDMSATVSKPGSRSGSPSGDAFRGAAWYAVQTLYRHEQRIASDLTVKGFPTYLPLLSETRQWRDRKKVVEVPVFSGYVFVRHDATLSSRVRVLATTGVVRMLGDNHAPVPVADFEIESLRRTLQTNVPCKKCEPLAVGTMVRVKRGALDGVRGRLVRVNSGLRLVLSVSTISQAVSVEVDLEDVEPVMEALEEIPPALS